MNSDMLFIEVEFRQCRKHGQRICGDSSRTLKIPEDARVISVLSDGLGSGVKAAILSNMTTAMACRFCASDLDMIRSAETMISVLPVCQVRGISYATFTILDCFARGTSRIIELDNPPFLWIRKGETIEARSDWRTSPKWKDRRLRFSELDTLPEDRIVVFSDGITQAGLSTERYPLGWKREGCRDYVLEQVRANPRISARQLAASILTAALVREPFRQAQDDMTVGVVYFRKPRRLMLLTGPPYARERDSECAHLIDTFPGRRVICGGTTAAIVARELGRNLAVMADNLDQELPPPSRIEGIDLVTEGILTLTRALRVLEGDTPMPPPESPAALLVELLLDSDIIDFVVGTRINEAHQDPNLPEDLEIRRNIIRRMRKALEERFLKETTVRYL